MAAWAEAGHTRRGGIMSTWAERVTEDAAVNGNVGGLWLRARPRPLGGGIKGCCAGNLWHRRQDATHSDRAGAQICTKLARLWQLGAVAIPHTVPRKAAVGESDANGCGSSRSSCARTAPACETAAARTSATLLRRGCVASAARELREGGLRRWAAERAGLVCGSLGGRRERERERERAAGRVCVLRSVSRSEEGWLATGSQGRGVRRGAARRTGRCRGRARAARRSRGWRRAGRRRQSRRAASRGCGEGYKHVAGLQRAGEG